MKFALPIILSLTLVACTTLEQSNRISTRLAAKEFNSIASRYLDRPTFVAIEHMSDKATVLHVKMSMYGSKESNLRFLQGKVQPTSRISTSSLNGRHWLLVEVTH